MVQLKENGTTHDELNPWTDGHLQDVGGITHFEHLNLEVPDLELARLFYGEVLGLTQDPGSHGSLRGRPTVVWYNIGRQQFHIAKGPVQQTPGPIGLVTPSLATLRSNLQLLEPDLEGTQFEWEECAGPDGQWPMGKHEFVKVTDPWGQVFFVREARYDLPTDRGITELYLPCAPGDSAKIADYYGQLMGASYELSTFKGQPVAYVTFGAGSRMVFLEKEGLSGPEIAAAHSGWHLAFYITHFSHAFQLAYRAGINYLKHPYRDLSSNLEEALGNWQFRIQDVVELPPAGSAKLANGNAERRGDWYDGPLLYRIGHEVRSLYHPSFMRPLYNRHFRNFDIGGADRPIMG